MGSHIALSGAALLSLLGLGYFFHDLIVGASHQVSILDVPFPHRFVKMEDSYVRVHEEDGLAKVYTLKRCQMEIKVSDYGAILMSVKVPDSRGHVEDILLGFDSIGVYINEKNPPYFGATIGRVANRIANAMFKLDGQTYKLYANDGPNTLHGGLIGFDKVHWQSQSYDDSKGPSVQFTYNSTDGEEGFPGDLEVSVTYTLSGETELRIEMEAKAGKKATPVNLVNHGYWNLKGHANGDVLDHQLQINAASYTPVNNVSIPTGELLPVKGTPFDFTEEHTIGSRIAQILGGYDHNYVLGKAQKGEEDDLKQDARVVDPVSGRVMELYSNQPGVQFYTSNYVKDLAGKGGAVYQPHSAFCLETQGFPNAINEPKFPTVVLEPGHLYRHVMVLRFSSLLL